MGTLARPVFVLKLAIEERTGRSAHPTFPEGRDDVRDGLYHRPHDSKRQPSRRDNLVQQRVLSLPNRVRLRHRRRARPLLVHELPRRHAARSHGKLLVPDLFAR